MRVIAPDRLKVEKGIPYTPDHQRKLSKEGRFPKPIKLGLGRIAYIEEEIDSWLKERMDARERAA